MAKVTSYTYFLNENHLPAALNFVNLNLLFRISPLFSMLYGQSHVLLFAIYLVASLILEVDFFLLSTHSEQNGL